MKAQVIPPNEPVVPARSDTRWYQVPLLWMCLALFLLMLAGCIHLIVISQQFDDSPVSGEPAAVPGTFFRMPLTHQQDLTDKPLSRASESNAPRYSDISEQADVPESN